MISDITCRKLLNEFTEKPEEDEHEEEEEEEEIQPKT